MKQTIEQFQSKILDWYTDNKRSLPRRDCGDPYRVFISEVMSQQTQVDRVVPKFEKFISSVTGFEELSLLDKSTLLELRSGLGFNSRALRLQQAAERIMKVHGGVVPRSRELLMDLPGI